MDHSTGASLGKVSFLVLWHIWTNLATIIAVNRWNVEMLCATTFSTLASNILQESLGTGHYLCRGGEGGKHRRGVKAISDCLDGEANLFL